MEKSKRKKGKILLFHKLNPDFTYQELRGFLRTGHNSRPGPMSDCRSIGWFLSGEAHSGVKLDKDLDKTALNRTEWTEVVWQRRGKTVTSCQVQYAASMFSSLKTVVRPTRQLLTTLSRNVRVTQPACSKATAAEPEKKRDYYDGKQRLLTYYLREAFNQEDPDLIYHDVSRGDHDFSSCDYLGLAEHPELNRIEGEYVRDHGRITFNRSGAYPRNTKSVVAEFEAKAAEWLGAEATIMTNSGTESNVNTLQLLLCGNPMPIYIDKYAHATFALGARASGRMDAMYFKHNDVDDLLRHIKEHGPGVVCVDTIYSALGTIAPIEEIIDICKQHDCILIADEAHALGTYGQQGEGLIKSKGLEKDVPFRTGSLGKSFGSGSGLIAFSKDTIEGKKLMPFLASLTVFSLAPQECVAARHMRGLEMVKNDQWRRDEMNDKIEYFRKGAIERGYDGLFVRNSQTNIIPFVVGELKFAKAMFDSIIKAHIYPSPHFYPTSPRNKSVIRFTICNFLTYKQLQYVLDFLEEIKPVVKPWEWPDQNPDVFDMGFQKALN